MENKEFIDITKFPEGPQEIMKYMDYAENDAEKAAIFWGFVYKLFSL